MNKNQAKTEMLYELERMQEDLTASWLDKSLPDNWTGMDYSLPVERHRTRVTLRLDSDMLRWFRKLGPGYGPRMNRVLRIYWTALLAGHVQGYPTDDTVPRLYMDAIKQVDGLTAEVRTLRGSIGRKDTAK